MSRLGPTGLTQLLTDIKTWITTKLGNYVTTDTVQTVTGKKYFTNSTTQVNSVNTFTGSTLFIDTSASAPRGSFPESAYRVGRIYIGDGTSYNGSWFIIDPTIDTNRAYYRMVTTNPDNTDSTRFTIEWNGTLEGARRRRNISTGDLIPQTASTYNLGESGNAWQDAYINKIHGISDYTNLKTNSFNANTTLTHGGSGRRVILAMGAITLTVPAPEEGSWFLIKAVNGLVTLNLASNVTVTGITAGVFSGPIYLQPNESILLCYYSSTTYNATISTIRRSGVVGRTGNVPSENPKHWFKIAENYVTATYRDPFICLRVFEGTTGNTIGTLCAHCRIDNTVGVVATYNCYLQWQDAGSGIDLSKYALTTNETSGTGVTISLWCQLTGGYASLKFEVVSECGQSDQLGNPEWVLTRRRQADGDLAELLDTDFTKIVYSTLTTLKNDTTGKASNVTGTVAIANGGTGATTRLNAVKALTNEAVGTPTHFLAITTNWGKAGYTTVAQAKTVLGITGDMGSHSDSEYVHMSGDETIGGNKTFSNSIAINGTYLGNEASPNERTNLYLLANRDADGQSGAYIGRFRQNRTQGAMESSDVSYITFDFLENSARYTRCFTMGMTDWDSDKVPQTYYLTSPDGKGSLGTATAAWNKVYANSYYLGSTAFGDIVTHNASEFLTEHPSITLSTNTTSTASPAHGGTFTCIDSVTQDTNGHITKVNTKTVTLPSDSNTDTLMTQNVSTTDSTYPILLCATANAASNQGAKTGIFGSGVKVNPKTSVVSAKGFSGVPTGTMYVTAVKDGGALVNSQATAWGAIWRAPTKDYQVAGATWSSNNNNVYICYSVTNANVEAGTNTMAKSLVWAADTGTLTTTTFSGALSGNASSATEFSANKDVTLTGDVTGTASSKAGWSVATTLANSGVTAGTYGPSEDVTGNNNATISVPEITVDAKGRVTSVTNRTLTCKNNTYNVYDKTLTIQKNGTNVATFTSNSNTDVTANITVPTKVSELTNDSGYLTSHQSLSNYVTLNGAQTISGIKTISTHLRFSSANTRGTAPSANEERDLIDYKDSAGNRISLFETMYYTDKSSKTSIYAYKTTAATGGNIGSMGIGCDASGNVYTYAPTPSSLDNSTKIATTAFVYNTAAKHLSAATNIYVAKVATGNGSGSNTSNYMALADLRTYLATVHMHSSTSDMNSSYNLQILFKAGDSFGNATFDATKMPGVRNLILNTSTGTNSTVNNYSTNSPTFGNITVTGDIAVTMRNLNCTGRISSQYGAQVSIDTYMGISSLMASNSGYLNVAKNMVINVCDAHTDYLFSAMNNGILAMWPGATVTINFRQQCYYTRSLFYAASNGTAWIGYSSFKLTGTEPMAVWGGSGTLTGTSETAAATVAKAVTLASGQTFTLTTNATAKVKFTVDNTAANPTLNIGGTGAKPIYWNNAPVQATMLMKNITYDVKYNGSQFVIQNAVKRLTNNDFGVFRSSGNYNQTYNSGSWNFTGWTLYYGTGIENSNWRGSHIGNIQQNVSTSNNTYPVLISGTANATANTLIAPYFAKGVKINPSTNVVSASGFDGPLTWSGTSFSYNAGNSLYFYSGQPAIANCFEGSSNDFTKFSYPAGGTSVSSSNANIQTLRLDWNNGYWHDLFMSPNNNYLWHRNVVNSDARGWRRIVEENVTGLADQSWNINIAGTAANVTGTVDIANGGTGATTRLNAVKALTNESVGTPTHFLAITTNYAKAGYTTVAQAKTVLGITGDIISHSDSEYVHMSGDETVAGVKTFSNNTYITSLNFTSEVESQSSSSSAVFPIVTTVTYADQSPSQTARLNFRITANGDKSLYPHENNQYSFGVTSRRWTTLYGYLANLGGTYLGNEASPNERTNLYLLANRDADGQSGAYIGRFRQNRTQGAMESSDVSYITFDFLENSARYTRCFTMGMTDWDSDKVPQTYYLTSPDGKGSLGTATAAWNKVYANSYYLGTTSFTDKFVTTDTAQTVAGTKTFNGDKIIITQGNGYRMVCNTDGGASGYGVFQRVDGSSWYLLVTAQNDALGTWTTARPATMSLSTGVLSINGNAATATQFSANKSVTLTGDVTGTASSKAGWSVTTTLANSGVTAGSYGPSTAASPAHGGTFSVPYVTVDAKGRITAASTKTITLPADSNTDTKVTQTVTTGNSSYPVLLCATANATATETTTSRFSAGLTVNTRYSSIYMTNKYDTANTKGVRDSTTGYLNGNITFRCYDASEMGRIHCESSKNGYQQTYMQARSYIKDGAISPEGTATTCYITVRVRDNGSKTIYTDGSWENSLIPYANATYDLGTSSLRWKACYSNAYYLGTTAFGDIVTHNASEFLTSHQSLANYVTTNTDQSISGIKSHSKHISILGDYIGNESSTNGRSCLYLKANRDTDGKSGLYVTKFRQNVAQGSMGSSDVVFLSHDILENETRTNAGFVESYSNWANDVPGGVSIYSTIATRNLGTSAEPWTNAYITNLNLNGHAFDPTSIDGVGTIKLLAYEPTSEQEYALNAGTTKAGSKLGDVWAGGYTYTQGVTIMHDMTETQSGTWKLLHYANIPNNYDCIIGLWVRIS